MSERCRHCEQYEKRQSDVRERRVHLWRRGELTDAAAEKLTSEEQRITEELREHQAMQHKHSPSVTARTLTTDPNLEEEIRRRAYELYEARGLEDGHDLDDWFRAEAAITGTAPKTAVKATAHLGSSAVIIGNA
jgi:hypothetical protein